MRSFIKLSAVILLSVFFIYAQESNREQQLSQLVESQNQVKNLAEKYLLPDEKDFAEAKKQGLEVFRLLPRNLLSDKVGIREGGAYYSFTTKSHDYDDIPQIGYEGILSVGFAGADYGFMADLGEKPLAEISLETVKFLADYQAPNDESKAREESEKIGNGVEIDAIRYQDGIRAFVGHSYVLRAISFEDADVLVAFKIYRRDTDGSLIIFWKMLKEFPKPMLERN